MRACGCGVGGVRGVDVSQVAGEDVVELDGGEAHEDDRHHGDGGGDVFGDRGHGDAEPPQAAGEEGRGEEEAEELVLRLHCLLVLGAVVGHLDVVEAREEEEEGAGGKGTRRRRKDEDDDDWEG